MEESVRLRPSVEEAVQAVLMEEIPEELEVSRIEIRVMGSGDIPYRLFPSDGGDYVGGVAHASPGGLP